MKVGIQRDNDRIPLPSRTENHVIRDPCHSQVANVFGRNASVGQMLDRGARQTLVQE
jgi:hypothetical protein